jgi:hypothetical protein
MEIDTKDIPQWAAALLGAAATLTVLARKLLKTWFRDGRDIIRVNAETDVVALLRQELMRVGEQNRQLADEVISMQRLTNEMRTQIQSLQTYIDDLRREVDHLRGTPT